MTTRGDRLRSALAKGTVDPKDVLNDALEWLECHDLLDDFCRETNLGSRSDADFAVDDDRVRYAVLTNPLFLKNTDQATGTLGKVCDTLEDARQEDRRIQAEAKKAHGPDTWVPTAIGQLNAVVDGTARVTVDPRTVLPSVRALHGGS